MAARPVAGRLVVVACERSAIAAARAHADEVLAVACAGSLHTSVIELLVRGGAAGVAVVSCPPRDCWNREGPVWLEQRLYHDREAELQARVDRRRVRLLWASPTEAAAVATALADFRGAVEVLGSADAESAVELSSECVAPVADVEP